MSLAETLSEIEQQSDEELERIEFCYQAAEVYERCADECTGEGEEMARYLHLCRDVADIASLHTRFLGQDSNYRSQLAESNAGLCEECAEECEQHDARSTARSAQTFCASAPKAAEP